MATRRTRVSAKTSHKLSEKPPNSLPKKSGQFAKPSASNKTNKTATEQPLNTNTCPVVAIGASAGGMEAFTQLLQSLPNNTGMAYVFIQHLDPTHTSMLTEILARMTEIPVREIKTNLAVEPNHIYIIPPNTSLVILHGVLHLLPREDSPRLHLPIDYFMNSLAEDQGNKAIGIILSGTASDGTLGLKAIKAAGGITFAQSPNTAKYDGMPRHAIAASEVDFVLAPPEIAKELASLGRHPYLLTGATLQADNLLLNEPDNLNRIFSLIRTATGADFTFYKPTTVRRRIMRRMVLHRLEGLNSYVKYLQHNPVEIKALSQDILIGVTSFFREPETFEYLKTAVFPTLIEQTTDDTPLRIWVPGCSTGEEAYSIAISLLELCAAKSISQPIQIFATDLNDTAIEKARSGIYPESIKEDLAPERLNRFFNKTNHGYQVIKAVRDLCVFAVQNIIKDPPFSRLDLISCHNVLIYFGPVLQQKVIPVFHYALNPNGYLILGTSESTGTFSDLFRLVDKKYKLYTKKDASTPLNFNFAPTLAADTKLEDNVRMNNLRIDSRNIYDLLKEADQVLLTNYVPAGIVVNNKLEIIHFRGQTDPYLTHSPGLASLNLIKMLRPGLTSGVHKAIQEAEKQAQPIRKDNLQLNDHHGHRRALKIEVFPLKEPSAETFNFLIVFEEIDSSLATASKILPSDPLGPEQTVQLEGVQQLNQLKRELAATIDYQQSIIEQREATNEELQAANEEIQSSNEELQSTHEEIETAKEELQATNEELTTVNDELRIRNLELIQVNNDFNNVLSSLNIPIVILDNNLLIRRFTAVAEKILNLIPTDVGRPLSDIKPNFDLPQLEQLIREVIETLVIKEMEVPDRSGNWYSLCLRPYKTLENKIEGVVMTFYDINVVKSNLEQVQQSRDYAAILGTIREPFLVLDSELRIKIANLAFYRTFQVEPSETKNQPIYSLGNGQWDILKLRTLLEEILPQNTSFQDFKVEHYFPKIGHKIMLLNARRIIGEGNSTPLILLAFEDITGRNED